MLVASCKTGSSGQLFLDIQEVGKMRNKCFHLAFALRWSPLVAGCRAISFRQFSQAVRKLRRVQNYSFRVFSVGHRWLLGAQQVASDNFPENITEDVKSILPFVLRWSPFSLPGAKQVAPDNFLEISQNDERCDINISSDLYTAMCFVPCSCVQPVCVEKPR